MSTLVSVARAPQARRRTVRPAWRQPLAIVGAVIAVAWLIIAIFAPLIAPHDPLAQTFAAATGAVAAPTSSGPTSSDATSSAA